MNKLTVSLPILLCLFCVISATPALAGNALQVGTVALDRPTVTALGVTLPLTGDDNMNAMVAVRFREQYSGTWRTGLPLFRVRPETVTGYSVSAQFAGSIFDLKPATTYEIELRATDSDGPVDQIINLTGTTRAVPRDPANPRLIQVSDVNTLRTALSNAQPGDIIQLADGVYSPGTLYMQRSGTAQNPIVIRGASQQGTVLDGGNCAGCNVIEVYGAGYVHIERLTIQNAFRAIKFQGSGQKENVVRRVRIKNTTNGITSEGNQLDYYISDNILEGRLSWPSVYSDDGGAHANDDGINIRGSGIVVAHNRISGYGDAMKTEQKGARANDFYGNDVLWTYDNGVELDGGERNMRLLRNRFTNTFSAISVQPIHGGPAYLIRNAVVNVAYSQIKFHGLGTNPPQETSGILVYNNTFVSPGHALENYASLKAHNFVLQNNMFVGPRPSSERVISWNTPTNKASFNFNGYYPDGAMTFYIEPTGTYQNYPNLAAVKSGGYHEANGCIINEGMFANGMTPLFDYRPYVQPSDMSLSAGSNAIDAGIILPNVNDGFSGSAPDLGALEQGIETPIYGVRLEGVDESNQTPPPPPVLPPSAPMNLTATAASSTQINLNWTDGSANEDGFRVERCQGVDCTNFVQIAQLPANATTYADTALAASTTYTYRVRAHNSGGVSDYSATARDMTQTLPPMAPAAPSNLVGASASTQINLQWTDNSNNETGFIIERSTDGITFTSIFTTGSNVTRYSNNGLTANSFYHYRVRAYNGAGTSANSNVIRVKTKSR
jgi:hypothetical protein